MELNYSMAKKKCQILVKNGARFPGIAIGIGQTHPKFHTTPIDGTKAKKPLEGQAPFEITVKDVRVLYRTLKMPEGHNPTVFGAVMRMPQDSKLTFTNR